MRMNRKFGMRKGHDRIEAGFWLLERPTPWPDSKTSRATPTVEVKKNSGARKNAGRKPADERGLDKMLICGLLLRQNHNDESS